MQLLPLYLLTNAIAATGMIAAVTISAIAAEHMLGAATWSGLPVACSILGTAAGSYLLAGNLERRGARFALTVQYGCAIFGAAVAVTATVKQSALLLAAGLWILGLGHGATQYVRYLAADSFGPAHRGRALSWVVWMGSIGAVVGPALLAPTGRWAAALDLPSEAGPYLFVGAAFAMVAALYRVFLPQPSGLPLPRHLYRTPPRPPASPSNPLLWPIGARWALFAMLVGHVVMVLVMTMTPLHLTGHGHGLERVGVVISAHIAGMFLLAPAVGWLTDRVGTRVVLRLGAALLCASCVGAAWLAGIAAPWAAEWMPLPLFGLGLGWNFGFVAGSAQLSSSLPEDLKIRARGLADSTVWIAAAVSSLLSSVLFEALGFANLSWLGAALSAGLGLCLLAQRAVSRQPSVVAVEP